MSSEYISVEIQTEILKRLPVKPLIRFRSVSKPWKCLIDSPDFIVSYGVRQPPHRFILGNKNKYFNYFDDDDHSFVRREFGSEDPCVPDLLSTYKFDSLVGSSHGLLCFRIIYNEYMYDSSEELSLEMLVLWNPSIRKSVPIPVPYMYNSPVKVCGVVNAFGFGVCPVTFDPVILKIKWMDRRGISPWRVQVFTLSTGTWNVLSTNLPRESIQLRGSQVVIDRFIYWLAFDRLAAKDGRSQSPFLIMSFDLTAKEFKEINLTGSLTDRLCKIKSLSNLRESLVMLAYHREFEEDMSVCSLWMMTKEMGVNRSFTKLYNVNVPGTKVKTLLGFRKTGKPILVTRKKNYVAVKLYDPNSEAVVKLHRGIDGGSDDSYFMCSYMESLLLLDQLGDFIYSISN